MSYESEIQAKVEMTTTTKWPRKHPLINLFRQVSPWIPFTSQAEWLEHNNSWSCFLRDTSLICGRWDEGIIEMIFVLNYYSDQSYISHLRPNPDHHLELEFHCSFFSSSCVASTTRGAQRQTQTSVSRVDDSEPQLSPHPGRDC